MKSERQIRLERIVDLRGKDLDERVAELMAARTAESEAAQALEKARVRATQALGERDLLAKRGATMTEWGLSEQWLTQLTLLEQRALAALRAAGAAAEVARRRVAAAQMERDKLQKVVGRVEAEAAQLEKRATQKFEDEFNTARVSLSREKP